jgi:hypothetical protein
MTSIDWQHLSILMGFVSTILIVVSLVIGALGQRWLSRDLRQISDRVVALEKLPFIESTSSGPVLKICTRAESTCPVCRSVFSSTAQDWRAQSFGIMTVRCPACGAVLRVHLGPSKDPS